MDNLFLQNLKGTTDYLPEKQIQRQIIIEKLKKTFEAYGFLPLETSILNSFELLASKYAGGAEILKEVYKLTDQGERSLALRYDLTVPFCKVIASNLNMTMPFRRYEIGKVFRNGPVKTGRDREFYQCDVDVCGVEGQEIEAEFFCMSVDAYSSLGIDIVIEWNNRKFLSGIIKEYHLPEELITPAILTLDKLDKIGEDETKKELCKIGMKQEEADGLFEDLKLDFDKLKLKYENSTNLTLIDGINEICSLQKLIDGLNLIKHTRFNPTLARGLEIYTGTVWEIKDKQKRISSSIGGGGRYDKIITKFVDNGQNYPAVGMCFGLEPIYFIYNQINSSENSSNINAQIFAFEDNVSALKIASILRKNGLNVVCDFKNKKLKKSLDLANKNNIKYQIIIGEEIMQNQIVVKNLQTSVQTVLDVSNEDFVKFFI